MKRGFLLVLVIINILAIKAENNDTLLIASYNIRVNTAADKGNKAWNVRKQYVAQLIKKYAFDIFGVQEMTPAMQPDLESYLPEYSILAKGRDSQDGTIGERVGIFYRTSRFLLLDNGMFWLSTTPDLLSYGWNEVNYRRICVWAKFFDKQTNQTFYFFNTHFPLEQRARVGSSKLMMDRMQAIASDEPLFYTGDFNATTSETAFYTPIVSKYNDSRVVSQSQPIGYVGTFNGQVVANNFAETARIDYIFTNNPVFSYTAINDQYLNDTYPSDHFPIMIKTKIQLTPPICLYVDGSVFTTGDGTKTTPFKSIEEAIAVANLGDSIFVAAGVYTPINRELGQNATYAISKTLTFIGETDKNGNPLTVLSGDLLGDDIYGEENSQLLSGGNDNIHTLITLTSAKLTLQDIKLQGGYDVSTTGKGGAVYNAGALILKNVQIKANTATSGGGIFNIGSFCCDSSSFEGNTASSTGGAVYFNGTNMELSIKNTTFENNSATSGSACYVKDAEKCYFYGNTLYANESKNYGALTFYNVAFTATTTLVNNTFANNAVYGNKQLFSSLGGSALYIYAAAGTSFKLLNNTFVGNLVEGTKSNGTLSDYLGGAIYLRNGLLMLKNNVVAGNLSQSGYGDFYTRVETYSSNNNLFTATSNTNILLDTSDIAANSYSVGLTNTEGLLTGTVVSDRFIATLTSNGGCVPTVMLKSKLFGNQTIAKLNISDLSEAVLGIDINNDDVLNSYLTKDQRGKTRDRLVACLGAFELQNDETAINTVLKKSIIQVLPTESGLIINTDKISYYAIYNIGGHMLAQGVLHEGVNSITLNVHPACYLVRVGGDCIKIFNTKFFIGEL